MSGAWNVGRDARPFTSVNRAKPGKIRQNRTRYRIDSFKHAIRCPNWTVFRSFSFLLREKSLVRIGGLKNTKNRVFSCPRLRLTIVRRRTSFECAKCGVPLRDFCKLSCAFWHWGYANSAWKWGPRCWCVYWNFENCFCTYLLFWKVALRRLLALGD